VWEDGGGNPASYPINPLKMKWWAGLGSNQRRRKPEDLQSF
jgi:hypothetical protein